LWNKKGSHSEEYAAGHDVNVPESSGTHPGARIFATQWDD